MGSVTKATKILTEDSAAAETIAPKSGLSMEQGGADGSKSRFNVISQVINQVAGAGSQEELDFWAKALAASQGKSAPTSGFEGDNKGSVSGPAKPYMSSYKEEVEKEIGQMFSEQEGLSPEFKEKAKVLFETALNAQVAFIEAEIQEAAEAALEEEITEINEAVTEKIGSYLDYVAEEWMNENEVAIESSLRNEIADNFIEGLRQLFIENNFNIPEEQIEVVDTLAERIESLESSLNDAILEVAELRKYREDAEKSRVVEEMSEGLTLVEAENFANFVENVEAEDIEEFAEKVQMIKESKFVKGPTKKSNVGANLEEINEDLQESGDEKVVSPAMKRYVDNIKRTLGQ